MKLAGLLLLPAGWGIIVSSVVLFLQTGPRWTFALAGMCIEAGGLALVFHAVRRSKEVQNDPFR